MKYIVVEMKGKERLLPFDLEIKHSDFAAYFLNSCPIISAGFVDFHRKQCYGDSLSLNLSSRPEDTILLKEMVGVI